VKILIPSEKWEGGTLDFIGKAFNNLGHEVRYVFKGNDKDYYKFIKYLKLNQIKKINSNIQKKLDQQYNNNIIKQVIEFKPDIFFSLNGRFFPDTVKFIKKTGIRTVCWVADYPFDSTRFKYFPYSLKYFDYLFLGEMLWEISIKNIAPNSKIIYLVGAYSPEHFKPTHLTKEDIDEYKCDMSFAGASYGFKAEGAYRAGILSQISDLGLKIYGDIGWKNEIVKYHPNLKKCYAGKRLGFDDLNILFQTSKINLNLPNPQCISTFQQRTFEIAGSKGFQLVDYRTDIYKYFNEDELVCFFDINDLQDKIKYFLKNPEKKIKYIENSFKKVQKEHTYEKRVKEMFEFME